MKVADLRNHTKQGINSCFVKEGSKDRETVKEVLKRIIQGTWVTSFNRCSDCNAPLLQKYKHQVKDYQRSTRNKVVYKTEVRFKKFKNQTQALLEGKHTPNCKFAKAISAFIYHGGLN